MPTTLAGMQDIRGALMEDDGPTAYGMGPTPEDMEAARQAVLYNKTVKVEKFDQATFDLSNDKQAEAYKKLMSNLYAGRQDMTMMVTCYDRQFVAQPEPRWIVHVEWVVYKLKVTANMPVQPAQKAG